MLSFILASMEWQQTRMKVTILNLHDLIMFFCSTSKHHTESQETTTRSEQSKKIISCVIYSISASLALQNRMKVSVSRHPFPRVFSRCSKRDLDSYFQKGGGMCLYNMPNMKDLVGGKKCGNGFVEEGEECDCGESDVSIVVL